MRSIRAKLTVALLVMSFAAIAVVGLTARSITLGRFDTMVVNRAYGGFINEATDYYTSYGSWEAAREAETFGDFVARTRPGTLVLRGDAGGPRPPRGPLGGGRPGGRIATDRSRLPPGREVDFGGAPPPFVVTDSTGRVLLPLAGLTVGSMVTSRQLKTARPMMLDGRQIGLAVSVRSPARTAFDEQYLTAVRDSWLLSLLLASIVAVPVGILMGNRFGAPIHELTQAIRKMRAGELRQSVPIRSDDEMGQLSTAFNQMSEDLATAYDELESSRSRLGEQAALLEELSRRDELTQALNRRAFDERAAVLFAQARRFGHPFTLAMADVDHFKKVNDDFSHAVGDAVLREVVALIGSNVREIDVVARYGGEEFAIAFTETGVADAARHADRLRRLVETHDWTKLASGLAVTLSVGVAGRTEEECFQEVLDLADARLYEAKAGGRNKVRA